VSDDDAKNDFFLGVAGDQLISLLPLRTPMSRDQALRLAAWIVLIMDPLEEDFTRIKEAIESL
jgi:hypothetical protein